MLALRDPALASSVADPDIRSLVETRFAQVCNGEPYAYDSHGYMIVVEPGDSVQELEEETSCGILCDLFDDTSFGDPDFAPLFDILEKHHGTSGHCCFEMLFITNDDGFGITLFIPEAEGIDADLLAMCSEYATPANVTT